MLLFIVLYIRGSLACLTHLGFVTRI